MSAIALRPFLPADADRCAEIFRASVEELAGEDYSADQRDAWAAKADDRAAFAARLAKALTLVALIDGEAAVNPEWVEKIIADRAAARAGKNWKESDRLRDELAALGVVLKDSKDGTTWEFKR